MFKALLWLALFFAIVTLMFRLVLVMAYVTPDRYKEYYEGLLQSESTLKKMIGTAMRFHYLNKAVIGLIFVILFFVGQRFS